MGIIQKRADELKPGDVIPANAAYCKRVVVTAGPSEIFPACFDVRMFGNNAIDSFTLDPDRMFDVESPELTTAQLHAEELAKAVDELVTSASTSVDGSPSRQSVEACAAILREIKPPEPPTLAEALEVLVLWEKHVGPPTSHVSQVATAFRELLDRARRAKVLP